MSIYANFFNFIMTDPIGPYVLLFMLCTIIVHFASKPSVSDSDIDALSTALNFVPITLVTRFVLPLSAILEFLSVIYKSAGIAFIFYCINRVNLSQYRDIIIISLIPLIVLVLYHAINVRNIVNDIFERRR